MGAPKRLAGRLTDIYFILGASRVYRTVHVCGSFSRDVVWLVLSPWGGLRAVPKYGFRMRAPNLRAPKRKGPNDRGHALNQEEKIQDDSHIRKCVRMCIV